MTDTKKFFPALRLGFQPHRQVSIPKDKDSWVKPLVTCLQGAHGHPIQANKDRCMFHNGFNCQ